LLGSECPSLKKGTGKTENAGLKKTFGAKKLIIKLQTHQAFFFIIFFEY
jgi:hypothetical protein